MPILINNILFSDEATFHTYGKFNGHKCRIWADEKPPNFLEWERDTPKVNIWLGMTQSKAYGPFFFAEATVAEPPYLDMLEQFPEPQILTDVILDTVVVQIDGAQCHYAINVRDYLNRRFPVLWIDHGGHQPWAARSPNLKPLDIFFFPGVSSSLMCTLVEELMI